MHAFVVYTENSRFKVLVRNKTKIYTYVKLAAENKLIVWEITAELELLKCTSSLERRHLYFSLEKFSTPENHFFVTHTDII